MINSKPKKRRKLSNEILGLLAVTIAVTLFLFQTLGVAVRAIIDHYLFANDIILSEAQYAQADDWVFHLSLIVSVAFFVILFLFCWVSGFHISEKFLPELMPCGTEKKIILCRWKAAMN